ncbi:hypothetical protein CK3_07940 [butyrate-producing bacterium SS3/4]|nr:hypothetical protein CK3_07940 [butyrate-producing bacterium SS3/4]
MGNLRTEKCCTKVQADFMKYEKIVPMVQI